jgi:hypothetical protein
MELFSNQPGQETVTIGEGPMRTRKGRSPAEATSGRNGADLRQRLTVTKGRVCVKKGNLRAGDSPPRIG